LAAVNLKAIRPRTTPADTVRVGPGQVASHHTGGGGEVKTQRALSILVLIASKHEWISRALETVLAPRGYVVHTAFTRADTLTQIGREPPDAVIVDDLPDITPQEFCRELRADRVVSPSTPVFVTLSSPPTRRDRLAAWRAGAWACLGDPLDAEELLAVLDAFLPAKLDADQARTDSFIDELTGVYNLRGLIRRARELGAQAARQRAALGCVLLAADVPDVINGDGEERQILQDMAAALRSSARTSDAIGRLDGRAFIIMAIDTNAEQARTLGQRLGDAVQAAQHAAGKTKPDPLKLFGGFSGVPDFRSAAMDPAELVRRATTALDRARAEPDGWWLREYEADD